MKQLDALQMMLEGSNRVMRAGNSLLVQVNKLTIVYTSK